MGGLFGSKVSSNCPEFAGVQLQTSCFGRAIPFVRGQAKVASNVIWYGNFHGDAISEGGGGKGGSVGAEGYNYFAAFALAICEGPISAILSMFSDSTQGPLNPTRNSQGYLESFLGTSTQTCDPWLTNNFAGQALNYRRLAYVFSEDYYLGTDGSIPNINFEIQTPQVFGSTAQTVQTVTGVNTAGNNELTVPAHGYAANATVVFSTTGTMPGGLGAGTPVYVIVVDANNIQVSSVPIPYGQDPSEQIIVLTSPGTGTVSVVAFVVDTTAPIIANDVLTDPIAGMEFPSDYLGSLTQWSNYCIANGLFLSAALADQEIGTEIIDRLAKATNTAVFFSDSQLKFVPYGDQAVTGNGVTYTPDTTVQYELTDDHFILEGNDQEPVVTSRGNYAEAYNYVTVGFADRVLGYSNNAVPAYDQANIQLFGVRPSDTNNFNEITTEAVARAVAQLLLQRSVYLRNTYKFKLGWAFDGLEPMDIVTLTTSTGRTLNNVPVRILTSEENDGSISFTAEDFPGTVSSHVAYPTQTAGGYSYNYNADPSNINTPVIFCVPYQISASGSLEVWVGVSGLAPWGGSNVYASSDGVAFTYVGQINQPARQGVLTAALPAGSDPDTSDALKVDLSSSGGTLLSGTQSDADTYKTLCYLGPAPSGSTLPFGGELVSFAAATLTGSNAYILTYLRRGAYGTDIQAFASGAQFVRLDNAILKVPYSVNDIGSTLYVAVQSFNQYNGGLIEMSEAPIYEVTLSGPPKPANVTGFTVGQNGDSVTFGWNSITDIYPLKGYDIAFGPTSATDFSQLSFLTEAAMGTEMTNAAVPPGQWLFAIRARDIANQYSPGAFDADNSVVFTVTPATTILVAAEQDPAWLGTLSGLVRHWTGKLVVMDSNPASHYTQWEDFGVGPTSNNPTAQYFVPFPVANPYYQTPQYDTGFVSTLKVFMNNIAVSGGPGVSGAMSCDTLLDAWDSGSDPGTFSDFSYGQVTARYFRGEVQIPGSQPAILTTFQLVVSDPAPLTDSGTATSLASGVQTVDFVTEFHAVPAISPAALNASNVSIDIVAITATYFTFEITNSATGAQVVANISWSAKGV